jgi:hypothetical protein
MNKNIDGRYFGSAKYWEKRYQSQENSGAGSYGMLAEFKAEFLNSFVVNNDIKTIIEFGCGDGNQLLLSNYPKYIGYDVSKKAVDICKNIFKNDHSKSFFCLISFKKSRLICQLV